MLQSKLKETVMNQKQKKGIVKLPVPPGPVAKDKAERKRVKDQREVDKK